MLVFKHSKMKIVSAGNGSLTLNLNINISINIYTVTTWHSGIFSMVSQPHSVQRLVEAHQRASVPLGRRRWRLCCLHYFKPCC